MIDISWEAAPGVFDAAVAGDDRPLRASLDEHGAEAMAVDAILATAADPAVVLEVLAADATGMVRQRALLRAGLSLLHADGDDREQPSTVMVAPSPAELVHVLLGDLGLGSRPPHDEAVLSAPVGSFQLQMPDQAVLAVSGQGELPAGVDRVGEPERHGWWGLRWHEPSRPDETATLQVLDVGRLWLQDGKVLLAADAVGVMLLLRPLLGELSRLGRTRPSDDDLAEIAAFLDTDAGTDDEAVPDRTRNEPEGTSGAETEIDRR